MLISHSTLFDRCSSDSDVVRAGTSQGTSQWTSQPRKVDAKRKHSSFFETFPVSMHGSAPPAKRRKKAGFAPEDRSLTDRWHKIQRDQRTKFSLCKNSRLPLDHHTEK